MHPKWGDQRLKQEWSICEALNLTNKMGIFLPLFEELRKFAFVDFFPFELCIMVVGRGFQRDMN